MFPHMRMQVAGLRERLAARLTDMRLLPRMRAHVRSQATGLRERLAARLADMRLLPRMRAHVPSHVDGRRERLAACLTLEAARCTTATSIVIPDALVPRQATNSSLRCATVNSILVHIFPSRMVLLHHLVLEDFLI